jgi:hypothetical protein
LPPYRAAPFGCSATTLGACFIGPYQNGPTSVLSSCTPTCFCPQETGDWEKLKVPKLEPQIEFSVGTFSHVTSLQSTSTLPFAAHVRTALKPHFKPFTSCSVCTADRSCPIPAHGARISRSAPACLRRDGSQHPWCPVHILNKRSYCCVLQVCARGPILVGWCWPAPNSRWVVLARSWIGRDEFFTSDNDQGVFAHLRLVGFLLVCSFAPRRDF